MAVPMWAILAGTTALKGLSDAQNRKADIESNIITQKYSPWTGQKADFSAIGKNNGMNTLLQGATSAYMAHQGAEALKAQEEAQTLAGHKADGDWYASQPGYMTGQGGISGNAPRSTFEAIAKQAAPTRAPAAPAPGFGVLQSSQGPSTQQQSQDLMQAWMRMVGGA